MARSHRSLQGLSLLHAMNDCIADMNNKIERNKVGDDIFDTKKIASKLHIHLIKDFRLVFVDMDKFLHEIACKF